MTLFFQKKKKLTLFLLNVTVWCVAHQRELRFNEVVAVGHGTIRRVCSRLMAIEWKQSSQKKAVLVRDSHVILQ